MSYLVLARKFRPARFDEVVGQAHVTKTLANAIRMDRVAHGFLFSGVRGVGKTSLARILAKSLNCKEGPTDSPCGECESCRSIVDGSAVDVIEIDGASNNSVDDIRDLRETVPYRPIIGRYKIYVIDEVHMLSVSAFNALLKTLEEPPPHVKFVFATTEPHKIPSTILSRIQRYDFRRIPTAAIIERIALILEKEGITAEEAALAIVGQEAEGSMRDALSIMDQVLAAGEKHITAQQVADLLGVVGRQVFFDLCGAIIDGSPARCLEIIRDIDHQGFDIATFTKGFLEHLRNLVVVAVCGDSSEFLDLPKEELDALKQQAGATNRETVHRMFKHLSEAYDEISRSTFPRILLEACVARLADLGEILPAATILEKLDRLEAAVRAGKLPGGDAGGAGRSPATPVVSSPQMAPRVEARPAQRAESAPTPSSKEPARKEPVPSPPREEPAAAPPPAAPSGAALQPLSRQAWEGLIEAMQTKIPAWASVLERAVLRDDSTQGKVVLQFDESDSFTAEQVKERTTIQSIEAELGAQLSHPVSVTVQICKLGEQSTMAKKRLATQEAERQKTDAARNHPVVKGLEASLGGKISQIRSNN